MSQDPGRLLNTLYTYIYCCWTGWPPTYQISSARIKFFQKCLLFPWKVGRRQNEPFVLHLPGHARQTLRTPTFQRRRVIWAYENQCFWTLRFSLFQNRTGVPILAMGFCMPSTCCKSCGPTSLTKKCDVQFSLIFQTNLHCFCVVVNWHHVVEATKKSKRRSWHDFKKALMCTKPHSA